MKLLTKSEVVQLFGQRFYQGNCDYTLAFMTLVATEDEPEAAKLRQYALAVMATSTRYDNN